MIESMGMIPDRRSFKLLFPKILKHCRFTTSRVIYKGNKGYTYPVYYFYCSSDLNPCCIQFKAANRPNFRRMYYTKKTII